MGFLLFFLFAAAVVTAIVRVAWVNLSDEHKGSFTISPALPWLITAGPLMVLWMSFVTVGAGTMGIVTRNGAVVDTLPPGAHFITPVVENVYPLTTQTLVVRPDEDAASHDLQMVHTQVTLAYHFDPQYISWIWQHLVDNSENAVENKVVIPSILEAIKASTSQYDAQDLISQRPAVRDRIEAFVKARLEPYHIIAENVSITDFHFSKDYESAIEAKVTAQQNAEKASNDLTRIKVEAEQKVAAAEGEAQALRAQKEQITPELLQLRTIEMMAAKWDGKLPENYYGGTAPLPMMEVFKKHDNK